MRVFPLPVDCKKYEIERRQFLNEVQEVYPNFMNIPASEQNYVFLMSNEDNIFLQILGKFVTKTYNKHLEFSPDGWYIN